MNFADGQQNRDKKMKEESVINENYEKEILSQYDFYNQINTVQYMDGTSLTKLISDVRAHIKIMEDENFELLHNTREKNLSATHTDGFLRKYERNQYNIRILQYLVTFVSKLPFEDDIEDELVDPFEQFKSFVMYNVNLLKENDVIKTILRYPIECGIVRYNLFVFFKWRTERNHREISQLTQLADRPLKEGWRKLFSALQRLCLFWFSVKSKEVNAIRREDVYIYLLTQILLNRITESLYP